MTKREYLKVCKEAGRNPRDNNDWRVYMTAWLRADKRLKK